jgi:Tfp pilus assembly protein PilV
MRATRFRAPRLDFRTSSAIWNISTPPIIEAIAAAPFHAWPHNLRVRNFQRDSADAISESVLTHVKWWSMNRSRQNQRRAISLAETLIAAVVLVVVVAAVSQSLYAGQLQVYEAAHRARAIELAEAMMDEILRLPYADTGVDNEVTRATFDDLADFDNYAETTTIRDASNTAYASAYQVFDRTVDVSAANKTIAAFGAAFAGLEITITVTDNAGLTWTLVQFVPNPA